MHFGLNTVFLRRISVLHISGDTLLEKQSISFFVFIHEDCSSFKVFTFVWLLFVGLCFMQE